MLYSHTKPIIIGHLNPKAKRTLRMKFFRILGTIKDIIRETQWGQIHSRIIWFGVFLLKSCF